MEPKVYMDDEDEDQSVDEESSPSVSGLCF